MEELRFGVIGTGMMGCEHLRNLEALPGARVVAVADPHEPSRDEARQIVEDVRVYADHRDMLGAGGIDAVVVATPNHSHRSVVEDVLGADLHLMVEKPLCTTIEDCRAVEILAAAASGLVWVGLEYRYITSEETDRDFAIEGHCGLVTLTLPF